MRLKVLGLYRDPHIAGQKVCSSLSILNALSLQWELQHFIINNVCIKSKNTITTKQESKYKNYCQSRERSPGPLAVGCVSP